jgi:hypothetical protein
MKKLLIAILCTAAFSTTLPALAGPDWQVIDHGRKVEAQRSQAAQTAKEQSLSASKTNNPDDQADHIQRTQPCDRVGRTQTTEKAD